MGHFEFYVKFYVNFCNNIICSEHLTHAILDLVTSLIYFNGILLGKIATLNPIWQLLKHADDLTVGVKHISDNQNEILLNREMKIIETLCNQNRFGNGFCCKMFYYQTVLDYTLSSLSMQ